MITILASVSYKYGLSAIFGAATKTYFDYKKSKVGLLTLIRAFCVNSAFALGLASMAVHIFIQEYPSKEHFSYAVAYLAGAIGINILAGLVAIDWKQVIRRRLR